MKMLMTKKARTACQSQTTMTMEGEGILSKLLTVSIHIHTHFPHISFSRKRELVHTDTVSIRLAAPVSELHIQ